MSGLRDARTMEYNSSAVHEAVEANKLPPQGLGGSVAMSMGSFKASDEAGSQGSTTNPVIVIGLVCGLALLVSKLKESNRREGPIP